MCLIASPLPTFVLTLEDQRPGLRPLLTIGAVVLALPHHPLQLEAAMWCRAMSHVSSEPWSELQPHSPTCWQGCAAHGQHLLMGWGGSTSAVHVGAGAQALALEHFGW